MNDLTDKNIFVMLGTFSIDYDDDDEDDVDDDDGDNDVAKDNDENNYSTKEDHRIFHEIFLNDEYDIRDDVHTKLRR